MNEHTISGNSIARLRHHSNRSRQASRQTGISIEIMIPRGGMCEYGLLGASAASPGEGLKISAPTTGDRWHESLVETNDEVYAGLPNEYRNYLTRAHADSCRARSIDIDFDIACHGIFGSNGRTFYWLAHALILIHTDPPIIHDDMRITTILQQVRDGFLSP